MNAPNGRIATVHSGAILERRAERDASAQAVAELYTGAPEDDASGVAIKVRPKRVATVLTGPPAEAAADEALLSRFVKRPGLHIVCGGTTAKIASRHLGRAMEVDLDTMRPDVPPLASMENIDLITEGILTLTRASELLRSGVGKDTVRFSTDGASTLARLLLDVDHVHFIVGQAVNPAHQNPNLPVQLGMKLAVVREIADELTRRGTEVSIESV